MNVLIIGHGSFIARHLKKQRIASNWHYISYKEYKTAPEWDQKLDCVINLALDPVIRQGEYSDLDLKIGQKAQEMGAHFIAMSSRAVYGTANDLTVFREDSPFLDGCAPYGQAKRLIETDLLENLNTQKLTILRPSNVFGFEYQTEKPRQSFFGQMLYHLKHANIIQFDMAAETQRDFIPVEVFVETVVQMTQKPIPGIFNVSSGDGVECGDIAHDIIQGYGAGALNILPEAKIADSFIIDNQKLLNNYPLLVPSFRKNAIKEACFAIGQKLQKET